jgi:hypothetical protein
MTKIKSIINALLVLLILLPVAGKAQSTRAAAFDTSRMQRDLEIMEAILDRLFDRSGPAFRLSGEGSRGIYLPGYGVLFQVPNNRFSFEIITETPELERTNVSQPRAVASVRAKAGARQRLRKTDVRDNLENFFANYADAIGQMESNERVAVYMRSEANVLIMLPSTGELSRSSGNRGVFAASRKADIIARRSGSLREEEFNKRMQYSELPDSDDSSELEVMARIVDTALRGKNQPVGVVHAETEPIYLEGLGALFLLRTNLGDRNMSLFLQPSPDVREMQDIERRLVELQAASKRAQGTWKSKYAGLRGRLGEILADYGHTLRRIRGDEWIIVAADLQDAPEGSPRELVCRVQKNAIDAYNNRSLSREQLLKKIDYLEF